MTPDPEVLRALESVLESDPTNSAIRLHLAELLSEAGASDRALFHLERVLSTQPDNVSALKLAADSAAMVGDQARSDSWRRLYEALEAQQLHHPPGERAQALDPPGEGADPEDPVGTDWDAELRLLIDKERSQRVTLADVAGLVDVKDRLERSFLGPMHNTEMREAFGASMRGGILLWGPPGCGKTFLARAVAGELGARFASIGLHDVLDMWLGNSEKKLHGLFDWARRHTPSVLFFDEIDAIGHARSSLKGSAGRNVVAELLVEMDGLDNANDGLFLIGATNQPWDVDPAFRRPGRLDHTLLVLPPDPHARRAILELHLRGRPSSIRSFSEVVLATDGFSGADLKLVCDEAAERALAESTRSGEICPITDAELLAIARRMRPSTAAWMETARNFATYANNAGEYDELSGYLRSRRRPRR